jgi:hypothetical protein
VIGYERDIQRLRRSDIATFFGENYGPRALSVAVVGDIDVDAVHRLAHHYFGNCPPSSEQPSGAAGGVCMAVRGAVAGLQNSAGELKGVSSVLLDGAGAVAPAPVERYSSVPRHLAETRRIIVPSPAGPAANVCFYRPGATLTGLPVALDTLGDVLSGSRSSRLYRGLVATGALVSLQILATLRLLR